jgi:hypothetical protein
VQPQIRRVGMGLLIAFLLVFAQLNYVQIFAAQSIAGNDANIRSLLAEYAIKRGEIETVDFEQLATSKATGGKLKYRRTYPGGELYGHITGWYSLVFGADRIERSYNEQLLGKSGVISMQDIEDSFLGSGQRGDEVRLTVHSRLQQVSATGSGRWLHSIRKPERCALCIPTHRSTPAPSRRTIRRPSGITGTHSNQARRPARWSTKPLHAASHRVRRSRS